MIKYKLNSAFTIIEVLTVLAIIVIITWAASLWINSFWSTSELIGSKNLFNMKIRTEKIWIIAWEIECSQTSLYYKREYFSIFNSEKQWELCKKEFFGDLGTRNQEVLVEITRSGSNNNISVMTYDDSFMDINHDIKIVWWKKYLSFIPTDALSYRIISEKHNDHKEELEIVFFNSGIDKIDIWDPKMITVSSITWTTFRKTQTDWNELRIIMQSPKPRAMIYLDNLRVNDITIDLVNWNEEKSNFNFFSAFLNFLN